MKRVIIIGASSGIGRALARVLADNGYILGLAARRVELLKSLQAELPGRAFIQRMDISEHATIEKSVNRLISAMGGLDLVIISSGVGYINESLEWLPEKKTIDVNVTGFTMLMNCACRYFIGRGEGHIVGISSIAALRGGYDGPAYNASKAFISNYMEGIRHRMIRGGLNVTVTDIRPGFVDTDMAKGEGLFWVSSPAVAAEQIYRAIKRKKRVAYITRRWNLVAFLLKHMPGWLYYRL